MDFHLNNIKIHASTKNTPQHLQLCDTAKKYTVLLFIGHYVMEGPENNGLPLSLIKTTILLTGYFLQAFHMCLGSPKVGIKHGGRSFWLETLLNT